MHLFHVAAPSRGPRANQHGNYNYGQTMMTSRLRSTEYLPSTWVLKISKCLQRFVRVGPLRLAIPHGAQHDTGSIKFLMAVQTPHNYVPNNETFSRHTRDIATAVGAHDQ